MVALKFPTWAWPIGMVPLRTLRGISLHGSASDHLWRKGAKIRGPEAALMMATVGRSAFLGQVDRPGLPTLRQRLPA